MNDRDKILFAADCAERVLHLYEEYCDSPAPRSAIKAARGYVEGLVTERAMHVAGELARDVSIGTMKTWSAASAGACACCCGVVMFGKVRHRTDIDDIVRYTRGMAVLAAAWFGYYPERDMAAHHAAANAENEAQAEMLSLYDKALD